MSRTRHEVVIGQRFERLLVLQKAFQGWCVLCDCGQLKVVTASELHRGKAKSCGCLKRERKTAPGVVAKNYIFDKYQRQAKERGHSWEITKDQFDELIKQACHYCGVPPSNKLRRKQDTIIYNGLDRKDNEAGYFIENVVSCCKTCNMLKRCTPYVEFVDYLNRVAHFRTQKLGVAV